MLSAALHAVPQYNTTHPVCCLPHDTQYRSTIQHTRCALCRTTRSTVVQYIALGVLSVAPHAVPQFNTSHSVCCLPHHTQYRSIIQHRRCAVCRTKRSTIQHTRCAVCCTSRSTAVQYITPGVLSAALRTVRQYNTTQTVCCLPHYTQFRSTIQHTRCAVFRTTRSTAVQ